MVGCTATVTTLNKNYKQSKQKFLDMQLPFENKLWGKKRGRIIFTKHIDDRVSFWKEEKQIKDQICDGF